MFRSYGSFLTIFLFSLSAYAETSLTDIFKESWWLILIIPVTYFLKRYFDQMDSDEDNKDK